MSDYRLSDLLDLTIIQKMADAHYQAAGMPIGIIDAIDGSILVGSGWQDICVKFHRANPDSLQRCQESDDYIKGRLVEGEACHYKCKNGLWDIGMPIVVAGHHLATMFLGQFFYEGEAPDREFFIQLAHEIGFDVNDYLAALDRVPVFNREKVDYILEYDKALVSFIADLAGHALLKIKGDEIIRESERKFHAIFDQAYQFLGLLSIDGRMLEANETALRFSGVEEADVIGKPFWETPWWAHSPELQEKVRLAVQKAAKGEFIRFEATYLRADGNLHYVDFSLKPVTDEAGRVVLLIPEGRDITERKHTEVSLKNQMEFVSTLLDTIPSPVFYKDASGRYLGCNKAFEDFWGCPRESIIGKSVRDMGPAEIAEKYEAMDNELFEKGGHQIYEWKVSAADGSEKDVIFNKATFPDAGGKTAGLVGVILDITERKRMERSLIENEARLRTLVQTIPDLIWLKDVDGFYLGCNTMFERFFGAKETDIVGKTDYDFVDRELADFFREHDRKAMAAGKPSNNEEWITFADDGHRALLDTIKTPVYDSVGKLIGVLGIARDITARKRAEEELRFHSDILRKLEEGIQLTRISDEKIVYANQAFENMFGYDPGELIGKHVSILNAPGEKNPEQVTREIIHCLHEKGIWQGEVNNIRKDGSTFLTHAIVSIINHPFYGDIWVTIEEDITERKKAEAERLKLEERLQQSYKMEAIGSLAGGIAHDFNNILSSVFGFAELAKMKLKDKGQIENELDEILKAGVRARDLVKQVLTFSRQSALLREPMDLVPLIKETLRFIRSSLPTTIEIRQDLSIPSSMVMADSTQIHQIIMNLCTNAAHAMKEKGGMLDIRLEEVELDSASEPDLKELKRGRYLQLSVTDTGSGIPKEIIKRIFDPFFTTKERGEGTGLGLSVVHGIVKDMGGAILVYSEPDKGTTFQVYFPRYEGKSIVADSSHITTRTGLGTILFVDDEESIIDSGRGILEHLGYNLVSTTSPLEALEIFRSRSDEFDLVLTDMTMPKMTGLELSEQLLKIRPDIPIVMSTGFSLGITSERIKDAGIKKLVMKPMIASELANAVYTALKPDNA